MSGRRGIALCSFVLGGLWSSTASAFEGEPPSIWYRSADGCPDGAAFIGRLHGAAEGAKLASVADRIDFVVTLGMKDGRAFGRLERQTAEGRAAVRELGATTCEEVADAIALTLTLALEPSSSAGAAPMTPAAPTSSSAPPVASPSSIAPSATVAPPAPPSAPPPPSSVPPDQPAQPQRWLVGSELTADKGSLSGIVLGDRLFLQFRTDVPWSGATLRVAVFFARRSSNKDPPVDVVRFGGRVEACPISLESAPFELSPCLGFDAGNEYARGTGSTALSDSASWLAASVFARGTWSVSRVVALEAAAGPAFPLTRNELLQAGVAQPLNRPEIIGLSAALGVALRLR